MADLLAARSQMAMSLAFHIVFAIIGIGMPVLMVLAERQWQRTRDPVYLALAQRWAKGTAILFAVGAVSGTVLSFELGLLWPGFMEFAGPIIGMPFSLEGFAFFTEAIFLGIYLYGRDRISPRAHLTAGVLVAVSGALSGIFVVIANAWMNAPVGFELVDGQAVNINPIAALGTPAAVSQTLHMTLAAYAATGFGAAGVHAAMLRRAPSHRFHRRGLVLSEWAWGLHRLTAIAAVTALAALATRRFPLARAAASWWAHSRSGACCSSRRCGTCFGCFGGRGRRKKCNVKGER